MRYEKEVVEAVGRAGCGHLLGYGYTECRLLELVTRLVVRDMAKALSSDNDRLIALQRPVYQAWVDFCSGRCLPL